MSMRDVMVVEMHGGKVRMNCSKFSRMSVLKPDNCYNCMMRNGYPENLGGDRRCRNFKPLVIRSKRGDKFAV